LSNVAARLGDDRRWETTIAVAPDAGLASRLLPQTNNRAMQGSGDLGDRLQRILDCTPAGPVVVIGTDIPAITSNDIAAAFRELGSHDAVFGPSRDGGYWLIGLKRRPRVVQPFNAVRWSSEHALSDTQKNLAALRVAHLRYLDDVDTADEFLRQRGTIGRRILPSAQVSRRTLAPAMLFEPRHDLDEIAGPVTGIQLEL
jgi:uncharacterized protein